MKAMIPSASRVRSSMDGRSMLVLLLLWMSSSIVDVNAQRYYNTSGARCGPWWCCDLAMIGSSHCHNSPSDKPWLPAGKMAFSMCT